MVTSHDHRDSERFAFEALMVSGFTGQESIATLISSNADHAAATSADDPEFGDRLMRRVSGTDRCRWKK
jgi:hypothetical protein